MLKKLSNMWLQKKTNNFTNIPLIHIAFDYQKYLSEGARGSCNAYLHPDIRDDAEVQRMIMILTDYIRSHYYMENFTKV